MAVLLSQSAKNYPAGTRTFTSANVEVGVTRVTLTLTREGSWPSTGDSILTGQIELSLDGGGSWRHLVGIGLSGGTVYGQGLVPWPKGAITFSVPDPDNAQRRLRLTATSTVTLRTAITVEVF